MGHDSTQAADTTTSAAVEPAPDPNVAFEPPIVAAAASEAKDLNGRSLQALAMEFDLAVDVIYHRARQAWQLLWHRIAIFGAIVFGSAAATDLAGAKVCALAGVVFATLDLVCDFSSRAAVHGDLARGHMSIVADLHRQNFSEAACAAANDAVFDLSAQEPAPFHAAREAAFNQTILALGRDHTHWIDSPWWRRATRQIWRYEGAKPMLRVRA